MSWKNIILCFVLATSFYRCKEIKKVNNASIRSPRGDINVVFLLDHAGKPAYLVYHKQKLVVDTSYLGFNFKDQPSLAANLEIESTSLSTKDENWETVWGEDRKIRNSYNQLKVFLKETSKPNRNLNIIFRVFKDGLGFRYEFPDQSGLKELVITDELTQFKMTGDHMSWWIPADYDSYEYLYSSSLLSEIDANKYAAIKLASTSIKENNASHTPLTMRTEDSLFLSIHEANLTNYPSMTLRVEPQNVLVCSLVPASDGSKAKISTPFQTPWRTLQIAERAGSLIESKLILNLNEPNKIEDVSWIQPMKYMGIWWAMHLRKLDWKPGPKHGAATKNTLRYIDFAAKHHIPGLLVEGWNVGWENWGSGDQSEGFDFTTPYEDFDIEKIVAYGKEKGVELVGHHETGGGVEKYDRDLEKAMAYYNQQGIRLVKTGYAGKIKPEGEYRQGQWMVNHYRRVVEVAAKNKIMIIAHEPIKPTGVRRTYPNMMAREGLRGSEFNAPWRGGNPAEHLTIVPFTRMLAGPIDYTPGIFELNLSEYKKGAFVPTTLGYQLAEYVVIYGPMQMASDLPNNYTKNSRAFQFIKGVPTDWETSKVINGKIGEYLTIVRKDRHSDNWYLGSLTNNKRRNISLRFSFLSYNTKYVATIYADGLNAHWKRNPKILKISKYIVTSNTQWLLKLAKGGGQAISFVPADEESLKSLEEI